MPTNRSRKSRTRAGGLTIPERHLLETGHPYPPRGSWKDQGLPWVRVMMLVSPAGREDLRELWLQYRDEIMATWSGPGLPWGAKEIDHAD